MAELRFEKVVSSLPGTLTADTVYVLQKGAATIEIYVTNGSGTIVASALNVLMKTNTTAFTPTDDYHPATKKYVDDNAGGGGSSTFTGLTDTPANYTNQARKKVRVNGTADALEFVDDYDGQKWPVATKSSSYSTASGDKVILANNAPITISSADISVAGRIITVKNIGSFNIQVGTQGSQTIDGANGQTLSSLGSIMMISDGSNLWIISNR